jgi:hypothetical protein
LFALTMSAGVARADVQTIDGVDAPIVRVNVQQGNVTVRTWDRPSVAIDADPSLQVIRRNTRQGEPSLSLPIPAFPENASDPAAQLPPENFVVSVPPGDHETVVVRDPPNSGPLGPTPVVITVPNNSVYVFARTGNGTLDVHDYRAGTFVGFVGRGRMVLSNVGGTAFAQTARGPTIVTDSSFDRFRGRSLTGNMTFERCDVRQIEATSIDGSIVYDGGSFQPGLARFESTRGNIAIGATDAVELGGHAFGAGHVYTDFQRPAHVDERAGETNATIDGGGPVVTAMTQKGNVYFYDGSLRARDGLPAPWQEPLGTLQRPGIARKRENVEPSEPPAFRRFPDYRENAPRGDRGRDGVYAPPPAPAFVPRQVRYVRQQHVPRQMERAAGRPSPRQRGRK